MILTEVAPLPDEALPLTALRAHLRLGSGFSDDDLQADVLRQALRAAMSQIEGRIARMLIGRNFTWVLRAWRAPEWQALPVAPVSLVSEVVVINEAGLETVVDPGRYGLAPDAFRPRLVAKGGMLPAIPPRGTVRISFAAGYGPVWEDVPVDLRQAVLMLAAHHYETRAGESGLPFGVMALIEQYRTVRTLGADR